VALKVGNSRCALETVTAEAQLTLPRFSFTLLTWPTDAIGYLSLRGILPIRTRDRSDRSRGYWLCYNTKQQVPRSCYPKECVRTYKQKCYGKAVTKVPSIYRSKGRSQVSALTVARRCADICRAVLSKFGQDVINRNIRKSNI
jgi:hypothetical protein